MKKCMIDLETLGTKPGCVILSLGAVMFDEVTGRLGATFYAVINQQDATRNGLVADPATVKWWSEQKEDAKKVLNESATGGVSLRQALGDFTDWLEDTQFNDWLYNENQSIPAPATKFSECMKGITIWGNGADFDQPILVAAYDAVGLTPPWKFYSNRCYRTLKNLYPAVKFNRVGTYHNALDDAKTQAAHAIQLLRVAALTAPKLPKWRQWLATLRLGIQQLFDGRM